MTTAAPGQIVQGANGLLTAAQRLAADGFAVFPCHGIRDVRGRVHANHYGSMSGSHGRDSGGAQFGGVR